MIIFNFPGLTQNYLKRTLSVLSKKAIYLSNFKLPFKKSSYIPLVKSEHLYMFTIYSIRYIYRQRRTLSKQIFELTTLLQILYFACILILKLKWNVM